jgi:hypothetical protein
MSPQSEQLLVEQIAPRIRSSLSNAPQVGADDLEEMTQDGLALAATLLTSAEVRGKQVSAGNIGYYSSRLVRQGRRSTGLSKTDPLHPAAQITGRCTLMSLDAPLSSETDGEPVMCLHDVLASRTEDPAMSAIRRLDWQRLVPLLDPNTREVLVCLSKGEDLTTLVPKLKRSRSALQSDKRHLAALVHEHLGPDILLQVQEAPRWRDDVEANRQKLVCRYARQQPLPA